MRIRDYFKNPIHTYVEINGEEIDVSVLADYSPCDPSVGIFAEQVEVCEVRDGLGNDRLDELLVHDLEDLEQRLLAMAYSNQEGWKSIAEEVRREEMAMNQAQRGVRTV